MGFCLPGAVFVPDSSAWLLREAELYIYLKLQVCRAQGMSRAEWDCFGEERQKSLSHQGSRVISLGTGFAFDGLSCGMARPPGWVQAGGIERGVVACTSGCPKEESRYQQHLLLGCPGKSLMESAR